MKQVAKDSNYVLRNLGSNMEAIISRPLDPYVLITDHAYWCTLVYEAYSPMLSKYALALSTVARKVYMDGLTKM